MFGGKQKRSPCYDWALLVQGISTVNFPQTIQQDTPDGVYNNTIEEEKISVMHEQLLKSIYTSNHVNDHATFILSLAISNDG